MGVAGIALQLRNGVFEIDCFFLTGQGKEFLITIADIDRMSSLIQIKV